ncbi:hypothetical protein BD309DRAFT_867711, partial [Dichomitus squalens]
DLNLDFYTTARDLPNLASVLTIQYFKTPAIEERELTLSTSRIDEVTGCIEVLPHPASRPRSPTPVSERSSTHTLMLSAVDLVWGSRATGYHVQERWINTWDVGTCTRESRRGGRNVVQEGARTWRMRGMRDRTRKAMVEAHGSQRSVRSHRFVSFVG